MEQLAEALKEYQTRQGLSLRGFAREFGVATGTAEGWLKGWRIPDPKFWPVIVEKTEVDELTIYRWGTDPKQRYRDLGLPTYIAISPAA